MTARPIRRNAQTPDRNGKIFYTSTTSLSHISKYCRKLLLPLPARRCIPPRFSRLYSSSGFHPVQAWNPDSSNRHSRYRKSPLHLPAAYIPGQSMSPTDPDRRQSREFLCQFPNPALLSGRHCLSIPERSKNPRKRIRSALHPIFPVLDYRIQSGRQFHGPRQTSCAQSKHTKTKRPTGQKRFYRFCTANLTFHLICAALALSTLAIHWTDADLSSHGTIALSPPVLAERSSSHSDCLASLLQE